jgi:hypothetical protein
MIEGTALYFSIGIVVFTLLAALTFNIAGGLSRISGVYVFSFATMAVLVGVCYKAILGEPAQSNLNAPRTDIEAYVGSMIGMFAAVVVSNRLRRKSGLLQNLLDESKMYRASAGCILFGIIGGFAIALLGTSGAKVATAFSQLNQLIPVGIIIGTMYEIRRSGGTRSITFFAIAGGVYMVIMGGFISFSKQGMLTPFYSWLLPVFALQYRLSLRQTLTCILALFYIFHYLVPYAQYGRGRVSETTTFSQRIDTAESLLLHPETTRQEYYKVESSFDQSERGLSAYYNTPEGFWERLQMISPDDRLIEATDRGHVFGLLPIELAFINVVPHFIWPNKPGINAGNAYAHDISGEAQGEGDTTTGISFSPTGEAYHLAKWTGVLVVAPLLWCMFFIVFDSLVGDVRASPWGILAFSLVSFIAPEGGLSGLIYLLTFGSEALIFCAIFAAWFAPVFAIPILGPDRQKTWRPFPGAAPVVSHDPR